MCGENSTIKSWERSGEGSPPRVRGKLPAAVFPSATVRITPACVGKTKAYAGNAFWRSDHPRVCGENLSFP